MGNSAFSDHNRFVLVNESLNNVMKSYLNNNRSHSYARFAGGFYFRLKNNDLSLEILFIFLFEKI